MSYDVSKRQYHAMGVPDGPFLYIMAGLTAGLTAVRATYNVVLCCQHAHYAFTLGEAPCNLLHVAAIFRLHCLLNIVFAADSDWQPGGCCQHSDHGQSGEGL